MENQDLISKWSKAMHPLTFQLYAVFLLLLCLAYQLSCLLERLVNHRHVFRIAIVIRPEKDFILQIQWLRSTS